MSKLTRIHVNQHHIRSNHKSGGNLPVISVKTYDDTQTCNRVDLKDEQGHVVASVIYSPDKPLPCGARVWIETRLDVHVG